MVTDKRKILNALMQEAIINDHGYAEIPLWVYSSLVALLQERPARKYDPTEYYNWDNECRNG